MKIHPIKFGIAFGVVGGLVWIINVFFGGGVMQGYMPHENMTVAGGHMGIGHVLFGLLVWPLLAGIFGWLLAIIYNKQL